MLYESDILHQKRTVPISQFLNKCLQTNYIKSVSHLNGTL